MLSGTKQVGFAHCLAWDLTWWTCLTVPPDSPPFSCTWADPLLCSLPLWIAITVVIIERIQIDVCKAHDNLWAAKIVQATQANKSWGTKLCFNIGDFVILSTTNHWREFREKVDGRMAKLMPRYKGKYYVIASFPEAVVYSIDMLNAPHMYIIFHASELHPYYDNNPSLFPSCELEQPGPVVIADGQQEWLIECIIDEWQCGRGKQYLVHFAGYSPNHNHWITCRELLENEVLDVWEARSSWPSSSCIVSFVLLDLLARHFYRHFLIYSLFISQHGQFFHYSLFSPCTFFVSLFHCNFFHHLSYLTRFISSECGGVQAYQPLCALWGPVYMYWHNIYITFVSTYIAPWFLTTQAI